MAASAQAAAATARAASRGEAASPGEAASSPGHVAAGLTASWPAVAAWGAGLVQAALGAAAIVSPDSEVAARATGVGLVTSGLAALAWGVVALRLERRPAPRATVAVAVSAIVADGMLLLLSPARTSVLAVAAATLLLVVVAVAAARASRRADRARRAAGVWGIVLAAAVVAVVVTPALGAAQDAVLLRDDGTLPAVSHDGH